MNCPAWANEKATIRRLYPHVDKAELAARKIAHRYWCSCGATWRPSRNLARDPERTKP